MTAPFLAFSGTIEPAAATGDAAIEQGDLRSEVSEAEWQGMVALLLCALTTMNMLGGSRSRGLGWVRAEVTAPAEDVVKEKKEGLQAWLKSKPWQ